jgi:isopentenyl-diphosphate delta-isomerase
VSDLAGRKLRHIEACLQAEAEYQGVRSGLSRYRWPYAALPELDLAQVDLRCSFLGHQLQAPLLIGAMTGGPEFSGRVNRHLAEAAAALGLGMMLGSQRAMLIHPEMRPSYAVRRFGGDLLLIGNLGLAQLTSGFGAAEIEEAAEVVEADALAIHCNPLQEALQRGGEPHFQGGLDALARLVEKVRHPLLVKEVGHGISGRVAASLAPLGLAAIDVAGAGGTCWARVEELVRYGEVRHPELCEIGIPTAQALIEVGAAAPQLPRIASGGLRSGLDLAKALWLGAEVCAVARPLLAAALESALAVEGVLRNYLDELRIALFVAGLSSVAELRERASGEALAYHRGDVEER